MVQVSNYRAVKVLAKVLRDLDHASPDVGMPPQDSYFIDKALVLLGLNRTDIDYQLMIKNFDN